MKYTCEAMRRMSQASEAYYHPYRQRKSSTTSTYSDCSSTSSQSPSSSKQPSPLLNPSETGSSGNIYDRLKQYISEVPKDPIVCQILLESLAHVIELEQQLAVLEEKTRNLQKIRAQNPANTSGTCRHVSNEKVPEDLANVDVTEFKHLVLSAPLIYDSISY